MVAGGVVSATVGGDARRADSPTGPTSDATPDPPTAAADLLSRLQRALGTGDRAALVRLADPERPESLALLASLARNARILRLADVALRYVDSSDAALSDADRHRYGADAWVADVEVSWRLRGVHRAVSTLEVPLVLGWRGGRAVLEGPLLRQGTRMPLWLVDRLVVRRTPDTLVLAADRRDAAATQRQAVRAVVTVSTTLPGWDGPLVVEVPADRDQFLAASGLSAGNARSIAAVTTTTDGSVRATSPVHVFVNPAVFDLLGPHAGQIVLSHEAAHVALGAADTSMPIWLSEGMADHLALLDTPIPVPVLSAQIRSLVRKQGPPERLPGSEELDGSDPDVGAWYEASWLAVRLLGEQHGQDALLRFYRAADRTGDTGRAFRQVLGIDERLFVQQWRAQLVELAR